jgi:glyoxylase-like metal-dependent hydrolase (beta-lactamase superfamily II)
MEGLKMIDINRLMLGDLQTNCFIVSSTKNTSQDKACILVDPGGESHKLIEMMTLRGLSLKGILITHAHFDHIGAVKDLVDYYGVAVYAHKQEAIDMMDAKKNLSELFSGKNITCKASDFIDESSILDFGDGLKFSVIEVAGHSNHSLCYHHESGHVFTGDTLFNSSIGRTDLYDGSPVDLVTNIQKKLLVLPEETLVYPGHGMQTSIRQEKASNPYLGSLYSF